MAQLMPLPLAVSGFSKIQIVFFTFLVLAHLAVIAETEEELIKRLNLSGKKMWRVRA